MLGDRRPHVARLKRARKIRSDIRSPFRYDIYPLRGTALHAWFGVYDGAAEYPSFRVAYRIRIRGSQSDAALRDSRIMREPPAKIFQSRFGDMKRLLAGVRHAAVFRLLENITRHRSRDERENAHKRNNKDNNTQVILEIHTQTCNNKDKYKQE